MTTADQRKNLFIKTWGCQMNVYDSRKMADVLAPLGYHEQTEPEGADMMILNTCHIREKATEKLYSELGRMRAFKTEKEAQGHQMILAVAGCVAQAEGDAVFDRAPFVDMVIGPQTYHRLPEMVAEITGAYGKARVIDTDFPAESKFDHLPEEALPQGPSAYVSVQEGCDKFCTFCVVPYTRGAEYSRPVAQVLDEVRRAVRAGAQEIILLGQNVNAYHGEDAQGQDCSLGRLIHYVAEIAGVERIRYTTSHPRDVDEELIVAHRDVPQLMPYLHLPVQSGSDPVLKLMNRKHTVETYRRIIERFREARPDIAFSSDFIIGFPGERQADFEATMQLVRDVGFAGAYSFKYSPRPGTPGANMGGIVPEKVKTERLTALQELLNEQQIAFNKSCVGMRMPVLFDRKGRKSDTQLMGRSPWNQSVFVEANPRLYGRILDVDIDRAGPNSLTGKLVLQDPDQRAA